MMPAMASLMLMLSTTSQISSQFIIPVNLMRGEDLLHL
jgi:hypothetical protein